MSDVPSGPERQVRVLESVAVAGAPVAYIVALAAVVTVLAVVPFSVVLGGGGSFPLSQAIYPLVGWILGPVAGAVATGTGALLGTFLFPHTTFIPVATVMGAIAGGFSAGVLAGKGPWKRWVVPLWAAFVALYAAYVGRAIFVNGMAWWILLPATFINGSALLFFILPIRVWCREWLASSNLKRTALGLFIGTWTISGLAHLTAATIVYFEVNWKYETWAEMIVLSPVEHLTRAIVGTVVGVGVIAGLRAIGIVKPKYAAY